MEMLLATMMMPRASVKGMAVSSIVVEMTADVSCD